ncbi:MAG: hypothetical protein IV105_02955 [Rhizobacter sp.]|nr:hypothetical protein [Rhizobacter sp.]
MKTRLLAFPMRRAAAAVVIAMVAGISACGGGADVVVVAPPPPPSPIIAHLDIALTRVGPEAVQVDWSDDPEAASFVVRRNGLTLAQVDAISLIDASVQFDGYYCYDVAGYDSVGELVSVSDTACITIF